MKIKNIGFRRILRIIEKYEFLAFNYHCGKYLKFSFENGDFGR